MRFLADVNAGGPVVGWLRAAGHDVVEVAQREPRMADEEILEWAVREDRIVVTTDRDFEGIIYRKGAEHCGILRLQNVPRARRLRLLEHVFRHFAEAISERAIVIAEESQIRVRHSPGTP